MEKALIIIGIVAFLAFVVYNVLEIVLSYKFYKRIESEYDDFIFDLIKKTMDKDESDVK